MKNPGQTSYLKKKLHFDILGSTCNTKYYDLQELASNVKKDKAILPTAVKSCKCYEQSQHSQPPSSE